MSDQFLQFLVTAKQRTYSAGDAGKVSPALPGSSQFEYRDGDWLYRDVFFGSSLFAGQEVVYYKDVPYWTMVYAGRVDRDQAEMLAESGVLMAALQEVPQEMPYRGPETFTHGDFAYSCTAQGDVGWFAGDETIFHEGEKVYSLKFQGGYVG